MLYIKFASLASLYLGLNTIHCTLPAKKIDIIYVNSYNKYDKCTFIFMYIKNLEEVICVWC